MKTRKYYFLILIFPAVLALLNFKTENDAVYISSPLFPTGIAHTDKNEIVITHKGSKRVDLYSGDYTKPAKKWVMDEVPTGVVVKDNKAYVTMFDHKGSVNIINLDNAQIESTIFTGSGANAPVLSPDGKRLFVCNQFHNNVVEIDLDQKKVIRTVAVDREPSAAVVSNDGAYLFVANALPNTAANKDVVAATVSVIDLKSFKLIKNIQLANGSNALRGMTMSPDGKYVFVTHNLGRFQVPTSQLQQGWMNTNAISIVNMEKLDFEAAVLLDEPERGAAGIWGVKCTDQYIVISHSGTHDISLIDYKGFIAKYEQYPVKSDLAYDLRFMYDIRERIPLVGNGPRNFDIAGDKVYIPTYFSDTLNILNLADKTVEPLALVKERKETKEQMGEKYFNDATYCFQNWQSCNGCHPGDARTDGMNWDLMNDGIGNPKNCKSMLYGHVTPPAMISGIRASSYVAVRTGFRFIQFTEIPESFAECVDAYLLSLRPVPSPYLVDGKLSAKAEKGKEVFDKLSCDACHSGPYFTDMNPYKIGPNVEPEKGWDTPTLIETWRTAPYLFDGRAATMRDVFETEKHGIDKKVSKEDIDALVEYVNSL